MKKIVLLALVLVSFTMNAQDKKDDRLAMKKERISKMNAEDLSQIQTKKMVLALDLSEAQQKQVQKLNLENAKLRIDGMKKKIAYAEKKEKPTNEARLKMQNELLDNKIATKREMKKILNETQYEKWNKMAERGQMKGKRNKMKKKMGKKKAAMKNRKDHKE